MSTYQDTPPQDTAPQDTEPQNAGPRDSHRQETPWSPFGSLSGRAPLRRAYDGRMLAGVCAGLADYFGLDVTVIRIAFAVLTVAGGAGVPAYLACLLLIPEEGSDQSIAGSLLSSVERDR